MSFVCVFLPESEKALTTTVSCWWKNINGMRGMRRSWRGLLTDSSFDRVRSTDRREPLERARASLRLNTSVISVYTEGRRTLPSLPNLDELECLTTASGR